MLQQHSLSSAYPEMTTDEYQALVDSVADIGVQNPITLYEGEVIDGWHRYRASIEAGVKCPMQELPDDVDPRDFARSQGARRNMSAAQQALSITKIYSWVPNGKHASGSLKTTAQLADMAGVSARTINQAKVIHSSGAPAVVQAVKDGKIGLPKAAEIARLPAEKQAQAIDKPMDKPAKPIKEYTESGAPTESDERIEMMAAIEALQAENQSLTDRAALSAMDATPEERASAADLVAQLRHQIVVLEAELAGVRASRDGFQREVGEMKRQCEKSDRQIKKLQKQLAATTPEAEAF
jgi:hypothetical protein